MGFRIYLSPPHMGPEERDLLLDAFDSNWIAPLGPHVDAFERELADYVGAKHAVAVSSGTAALHLALLNIGVGRGDRVLCPTLTFAATANAITYVGAEPVFIDADESTWQMDPALVAQELDRAAGQGELPAAIITVDLYGQCADHDAVLAAAATHGVPVIEDAAEGLGATYKGRSAGTFGRAGAFSFNGNKIMTTSGGGMLVTDDEDMASRARYLATQARQPVAHYEHQDIGYNYRLSNLLAAVGRGQLQHLNERVARRREINATYRHELGDLPGVTFMPEAPYGEATFWLTCMTLSPQAAARPAVLQSALGEHDIEARPVWKPMHLQPVFGDAPRLEGTVAERLFTEGLCLPSGSSMTAAEQDEVIGIVGEALSRRRRSGTRR